LLRDLEFFVDSGFDSYADTDKISELTIKMVEKDVGDIIKNTFSVTDIEHALGA